MTDAFPDHSVTLAVHFGEILGLAGLVGSGRTSVAQTIFGVQRSLGGTSHARWRTHFRARRHAMRSRKGIYLIPEDRKRTGLVLDLPIVENISLADLRTYTLGTIISGSREQKVAEEQRRSLDIKAPSVDTAVPWQIESHSEIGQSKKDGFRASAEDAVQHRISSPVRRHILLRWRKSR